MSAFARIVPLTLAIFSGVVGGYYTFGPLFDPKMIEQEKQMQAKAEARRAKMIEDGVLKPDEK